MLRFRTLLDAFWTCPDGFRTVSDVFGWLLDAFRWLSDVFGWLLTFSDGFSDVFGRLLDVFGRLLDGFRRFSDVFVRLSRVFGRLLGIVDGVSLMWTAFRNRGRLFADRPYPIFSYYKQKLAHGGQKLFFSPDTLHQKS